ncbi:hypothetical protein [Agrobacterium tumefaciens]|uniref:hypothetical protein n=1 Tax=Agrobacterium tumefaciens TaxID=358 RepID=UPI0015749196|nr:hypothetical protein [Agrobacterium tumefaciens]NTD85728.1 hypothetical protein [Agrobacterium tumefaciens]NTD89716.1 hypothetical protein [Agrobacterium tumefaciens]NTE21997.1 hypothetical protein [Agrobacterium tumefaciens]NTE31647.1 hypothetical protein [Agrobacterium tumefaciens]NTE41890.1 hypothetical protein [Agrobacterium tumefaciens]
MAEGKTFPTFEDSKREGENIVRAKNDEHRETEKGNQEKLTGQHRSAMEEGIGNSESAASTASGEAQSQWQAKVAAVDAQHGREVSADENAQQAPTDRKAAYHAELARRDARSPEDKPFDRKAAYEASKSKQQEGDGAREANELREHRNDRWDR